VAEAEVAEEVAVEVDTRSKAAEGNQAQSRPFVALSAEGSSCYVAAITARGWAPGVPRSLRLGTPAIVEATGRPARGLTVPVQPPTARFPAVCTRRGCRLGAGRRGVARRQTSQIGPIGRPCEVATTNSASAQRKPAGPAVTTLKRISPDLLIESPHL
jgi:hypothetical protein